MIIPNVHIRSVCQKKKKDLYVSVGVERKTEILVGRLSLRSAKKDREGSYPRENREKESLPNP